MSSNLFKSEWIVMDPGKSRVIDSNAVVEKSIKNQREKMEVAIKEEDDDFTEGLDAMVVASLLEQGAGELSAEEEQQERSRMTEEILQEAHVEAERIVDKARKEADGIRKLAEEQGRQAGYQQGTSKGVQECEVRLQSLEEEKKKWQEEYVRKLDELEPHLVDVIADIYEHVIRIDLGNRRDLIVHLIADTLRSADASTGFLVHVSKEDYPFVSMQKKELTGGIQSNVTLEIIEDITLKKNECMIETGSGIYDCGLDTQLAQLRKELMLLAYQKSE